MSSKKQPDEIQWDLLDRCVLPLLFSHALAFIISTILNTLRISQVSCFALFALFLLISIGFTIFYHNLYVSAAGKAVLITSCDNVIGYSLASQLDDWGFTVYAGFPNKADGKKLKDECSGRVHIVKLDMTSEDDILAVRDYIAENLPLGAPGLWAVINNTTWTVLGEFECIPPHIYQKTMEINFLNVIKICHLLLPSLRKTQGRIINVSSVSGRIPSAMRSPLCAVKAAIEAFSLSISAELSRWSINVIIVEPGNFTTGLSFDDKKIHEDAKEMWFSMDEKSREAYGERYFEYKMTSVPEYRQIPRDANVAATVRSIIDATSRTFPMIRYTPITRQEKIQLFVADHFPVCIYRALYA